MDIRTVFTCIPRFLCMLWASFLGLFSRTRQTESTTSADIEAAIPVPIPRPVKEQKAPAPHDDGLGIDRLFALPHSTTDMRATMITVDSQASQPHPAPGLGRVPQRRVSALHPVKSRVLGATFKNVQDRTLSVVKRVIITPSSVSESPRSVKIEFFGTRDPRPTPLKSALKSSLRKRAVQFVLKPSFLPEVAEIPPASIRDSHCSASTNASRASRIGHQRPGPTKRESVIMDLFDLFSQPDKPRPSSQANGPVVMTAQPVVPPRNVRELIAESLRKRALQVPHCQAQKTPSSNVMVDSPKSAFLEPTTAISSSNSTTASDASCASYESRSTASFTTAETSPPTTPELAPVPCDPGLSCNDEPGPITEADERTADVACPPEVVIKCPEGDGLPDTSNDGLENLGELHVVLDGDSPQCEYVEVVGMLDDEVASKYFPEVGGSSPVDETSVEEISDAVSTSEDGSMAVLDSETTLEHPAEQEDHPGITLASKDSEVNSTPTEYSQESLVACSSSENHSSGSDLSPGMKPLTETVEGYSSDDDDDIPLCEIAATLTASAALEVACPTPIEIPDVGEEGTVVSSTPRPLSTTPIDKKIEEKEEKEEGNQHDPDAAESLQEEPAPQKRISKGQFRKLVLSPAMRALLAKPVVPLAIVKKKSLKLVSRPVQRHISSPWTSPPPLPLPPAPLVLIPAPVFKASPQDLDVEGEGEGPLAEESAPIEVAEAVHEQSSEAELFLEPEHQQPDPDTSAEIASESVAALLSTAEVAVPEGTAVAESELIPEPVPKPSPNEHWRESMDKMLQAFRDAETEDDTFGNMFYSDSYHSQSSIVSIAKPSPVMIAPLPKDPKRRSRLLKRMGFDLKYAGRLGGVGALSVSVAMVDRSASVRSSVPLVEGDEFDEVPEGVPGPSSGQRDIAVPSSSTLPAPVSPDDISPSNTEVDPPSPVSLARSKHLAVLDGQLERRSWVATSDSESDMERVRGRGRGRVRHGPSGSSSSCDADAESHDGHERKSDLWSDLVQLDEYFS